MAGINRINTSTLKSYKNSFNDGKNSFSRIYSSFSYSYIRSCSDPYVQRMGNNLRNLYINIQNGYNNIDSWWSSYNTNAEALERFIAGIGSSGAITEYAIRSYASSKLPALDTQHKKTTSRLASVTGTGVATAVRRGIKKSTINSVSVKTRLNNLFSEYNNITPRNDVFSRVSANVKDRDQAYRILECAEKVRSSFSNAASSRWSNYEKYGVSKKVSFWENLVNCSATSTPSGTALPTFSQSAQHAHTWEAQEKAAASSSTVVYSLLEGVGQSAESLVDGVLLMGAGLTTPFAKVTDIGADFYSDVTGTELSLYSDLTYSHITGQQYDSATERLWAEAQAMTSKQYVTGFMNDFYETDGKWIKENTNGFDTIRNVGNGIGYTFGIMGAAFLTCGASSAAGVPISMADAGAAIAGVAGFGKHTTAAWNAGADLEDGLIYGARHGAYDAFEWVLGSKINGLNVFKTPAGNMALHVACDSADGATSPLVESYLQLDYIGNSNQLEDVMYLVNHDENGNQISNKTWDDLTDWEKYMAVFEYNGGVKSVFQSGAMAGSISFLSEVGGLSQKARDIDMNAKSVKSNVSDSVNTKNVTDQRNTDINISKRVADGLQNMKIKSNITGNGLATKFNEILGNLTGIKNKLKGVTIDQIKGNMDNIRAKGKDVLGGNKSSVSDSVNTKNVADQRNTDINISKRVADVLQSTKIKSNITGDGLATKLNEVMVNSPRIKSKLKGVTIDQIKSNMDNIRTKGKDVYGGNQSSFYDNLNKIIKSKNVKQDLAGIEDTIRKYYPDCDKKQIAKIANKISDGGCKYVSTANIILEQLGYDSKKFMELFGYSMFKSDGTIDFDRITTDLYVCMNDKNISSPIRVTGREEVYKFSGDFNASSIEAAKVLLGKDYTNWSDAFTALFDKGYRIDEGLTTETITAFHKNTYLDDNGSSGIYGTPQQLNDRLFHDGDIITNVDDFKNKLKNNGYLFGDYATTYNKGLVTNDTEKLYLDTFFAKNGINLKSEFQNLWIKDAADLDIISKYVNDGYSIMVSTLLTGVPMTNGKMFGFTSTGGDVGHAMTFRAFDADGNIVVSSWGELFTINKVFADKLDFKAIKITDNKLDINSKPLSDSAIDSSRFNSLDSDVTIGGAQIKFKDKISNLKDKLKGVTVDKIKENMKKLSDAIMDAKVNREVNREINFIQGKQELRDGLDAAVYFSDAKQYLYQKLKMYAETSGDPTVIAFYNKILSASPVYYKDKIARHETPVHELNADEIYGFLDKNKYLSDKDKKVYEVLSRNKAVYTQEQQAAISIFTMFYGPDLAAYNRHTFTKFGKSSKDGINLKGLQKDLDKICGLYNSNYGANVRFTVDRLNQLMDEIVAQNTLKRDLTLYRGVDELFFDNKEINIADLKVGDILNDEGHNSTSVFPTGIVNDRNYMLEIKAPKGTPYAYLEQCTGVGGYGQQEVLLGRKTNYKVVGISRDIATGKPIITVEIVPDIYAVKQRISRLNELFTKKRAYENSPEYKIYNEYVKNGLTPPLTEMSGVDWEIASLKVKLLQYGIDVNEKNISDVMKKLEDGKIKADVVARDAYEGVDLIYYKDDYVRTFSPYQDGINLDEFINTVKKNGIYDRLSREVDDMYNRHLYDNSKLGEHDYQHVKNVMLYSMDMGKKLKLSDADLEMLIDAAKYHDTGVTLTSSNALHAQESVKFVQRDLASKYSPRDLNKIMAIVEYHGIDDKLLNNVCAKYGITNKREIAYVERLGGILKDADALDRSRFPGNLDVNHIRNKGVANDLVKTSFQLREAMASKELGELLGSEDLRQNNPALYSELLELYNSEQYPDSIIVFANKYYPIVGRRRGCYSVTDYANFIMRNRRF